MAAVSVAAGTSAESNRLNVGSAVTTYYDDRSEGPTCLLIHGTGGTMDRHYRSLIPLLARGYRVVGLDLGMPAADERLELHHLVDQVEAVVEAAKLCGTGLTVIGYSLGAVVAAAYAARRPAEPSRLVLINGWAKADAHQLLRNGIWQGLYDSAIEQLPRLTVFTSYSARFLNTRTPQEIDLLIAGTTVDEVRKRQMELNATADITSLLGSITCPTLVLAGEHDITVPLTQGYALLGGIADARLVSIPSGHAALAERPERVFDLIDRFIREGEDRPPHRG